MLTPIPHDGLHDALDHALRTEDVKFSPSGRVLAVAATNGSISLFEVDPASRPVHIGRHVELHSASLASPHGVDFLAEDLIVVSNRAAWVTFYRIPPVTAWLDRLEVEAIREMDSPWFGRKGATRKLENRNVLCGPGSVRVHAERLFVSCNNLNTVTAHPYRWHEGRLDIGDGAIVAQSGLEIPDGVSVSRDGRWLAVSNHYRHGVEIGRADSTERSCVLRDPELRYPHGLCFDPGGRALYVADAGERQVHVFVRPNGEWDRSSDTSAFKLPAVEMDAFRKTKDAVPEARFKVLEGGIKGIDVDPSGRLVVTTCRHQALRFFESAIPPANGSPVAE